MKAKKKSVVKQKIQALLLKSEGILQADSVTPEMRELADSCRELAKEMRLCSGHFLKRSGYEPEEDDDVF